MKSDHTYSGSSGDEWTAHAILLTCIFASAWVLAACGQQPEKPATGVTRPVKVMKLESQSQSWARRFPGRVQAHRRADLSFKVSGRLTELLTEEGDQVKQGQLLARLDPQDLQAQVDSASGQLAKANASLDLAKTEYQRVIRIQKEDPGAVSQSMVDQRREGVNQAQAEIQSLRAALNAAKLNLSYTELRAPFTGVVSKRYVNNYQDVQAKEIIVHIDDISIIEIKVDIPENVMALLRQGVEAEIFAEFSTAPGKQYPLTVYEFSTRADPQTQTYQLTLRMDQPKEINVLPGMTASVVGSRKTAVQVKDVFIIPAVAVVADDAGKAQVWVINPDDNKVRARKVTTADLTGTASIYVTAGLKPDEMIAISGVSQLREGMQVRPVDKIDY